MKPEDTDRVQIYRHGDVYLQFQKNLLCFCKETEPPSTIKRMQSLVKGFVCLSPSLQRDDASLPLCVHQWARVLRDLFVDFG